MASRVFHSLRRTCGSSLLLGWNSMLNSHFWADCKIDLMSPTQVSVESKNLPPKETQDLKPALFTTFIITWVISQERALGIHVLIVLCLCASSNSSQSEAEFILPQTESYNFKVLPHPQSYLFLRGVLKEGKSPSHFTDQENEAHCTLPSLLN